MRDDLVRERDRLAEIAKQAERGLGKAPEGRLRIDRGPNNVPRYYRLMPDGKSVYLKAGDMKIIERLAQKRYDEKVLSVASTQVRRIDALLFGRGGVKTDARGKSGPKRESGNRGRIARGAVGIECIREVYAALGEERKALVVPYELPDDAFAEVWERENASDKLISSAGCVHVTAKGDCVRSKSEVIIADALYRAGVAYVYEKPFFPRGGGVIHPDFTVLNKRTRRVYLWEHFGLMDDEGYTDACMKRLAGYADNDIVLGDKLLATFETSQRPLTPQVVAGIIKRVLV